MFKLARRGALHAWRLDTDGDWSDAVAGASVTLATTTHFLATHSHVWAVVEFDVRLTVGACHAQSTYQRATNSTCESRMTYLAHEVKQTVIRNRKTVKTQRVDRGSSKFGKDLWHSTINVFDLWCFNFQIRKYVNWTCEDKRPKPKVDRKWRNTFGRNRMCHRKWSGTFGRKPKPKVNRVAHSVRCPTIPCIWYLSPLPVLCQPCGVSLMTLPTRLHSTRCRRRQRSCFLGIVSIHSEANDLVWRTLASATQALWPTFGNHRIYQLQPAETESAPNVVRLLSAETECPPKVPIYPHSAPKPKPKPKFGRPLDVPLRRFSIMHELTANWIDQHVT